jgi:predicted amidophosphoribosyltransferase
MINKKYIWLFQSHYNQEVFKMETLCRNCGHELFSIEICMNCNGPIQMKCPNCNKIKELIHHHVVMPISMTQ